MSDQVNRVSGPTYRVDQHRDATEQEGQKKKRDEDDQEDAFDQMSDHKQWDTLFDQSHLWQRNIEIKTDDVSRAKILGINVNSNPAVIKLRLTMVNGDVYPVVFLSLSRSKALKLKNQFHSLNVEIPVHEITTDVRFWVTVPVNEDDVDSEITRISRSVSEPTRSQTLRLFLKRKGWLIRLGIRDVVTRRFNTEVILIYLTLIGLLLFFAVIGFILSI